MIDQFLIQIKYHNKTKSNNDHFGKDSGFFKVYKSFILNNYKYNNVNKIIYNKILSFIYNFNINKKSLVILHVEIFLSVKILYNYK